jgi:hypothetical protein
MVGQAKNAVDTKKKGSPVTFRPKKVFKLKSLGVDEQSVRLENKCHSGRREP